MKRMFGESYQNRAVVLQQLGFKSYKDYLKSDLWKKVKQKVFRKKGSYCSLCNNPATTIHHNRYHRNDLIGKKTTFLNPICHECHQKIEFSDTKKSSVREAHLKFQTKRYEYLTTKELSNLLLNFDAEDYVIDNSNME